MVTSVNGSRELGDIRKFVDQFLLAKDARAIREAYSNTAPDLDLKFTYTNSDGSEEEVALPITISFFWPDA